MSEKVQVELTRNNILTLFNSLLVRDKCIFVRVNTEWEELLNMLWKEITDRVKFELLWDKEFRVLLDKWNIQYQEDLTRIGIPEILVYDDDEEE